MLRSFLSGVAETSALNILNLFISNYYFSNVAGLKITDAADWLWAVCVDIIRNPTACLDNRSDLKRSFKHLIVFAYTGMTVVSLFLGITSLLKWPMSKAINFKALQ